MTDVRQSHLPTLPAHPFFCVPLSVGYYKQQLNHSVYRGKNSLNEFNLHVVVNGTGYVKMEGQVYSLQRGDAFLYFPMEEQYYYSSLEEPWDVRWVHFTGHKLKEYLLEQGFHRSTIWSMKQLKPLEEIHERLLSEAEQHKILHESRLSALTYEIIAEFMVQAIPYTNVKGVGTSIERIVNLLPSMQEQACEPFELEYWAQLAGISPYYFCKLFRKATRMTPMAFITLCRMQYGKQRLLEYPDLPVKQIAMEAGYPSASYFNKRFFEHERMTPTEFRMLRG